MVSIFSTQVSSPNMHAFKVSKANGMYRRDYAFRMNVKEEIFEIRTEAVFNVSETDSTTTHQHDTTNYSCTNPLHISIFWQVQKKNEKLLKDATDTRHYQHCALATRNYDRHKHKSMYKIPNFIDRKI